MLILKYHGFKPDKIIMIIIIRRRTIVKSYIKIIIMIIIITITILIMILVI